MLHAFAGSYTSTAWPRARSSLAMPRRKWALPWFQSEMSEWQKITMRTRAPAIAVKREEPCAAHREHVHTRRDTRVPFAVAYRSTHVPGLAVRDRRAAPASPSV